MHSIVCFRVFECHNSLLETILKMPVNLQNTMNNLLHNCYSIGFILVTSTVYCLANTSRMSGKYIYLLKEIFLKSCLNLLSWFNTELTKF